MPPCDYDESGLMTWCVVVSILVLVDAALRPVQHCSSGIESHRRPYVSILVLVDAALRQGEGNNDLVFWDKFQSLF